jgi:hypothetical protein
MAGAAAGGVLEEPLLLALQQLEGGQEATLRGACPLPLGAHLHVNE